MNELCNISNKYQPPCNLPSINIFTQGTLYIYFEKILVLFIANVFWNIHFMPHFHYFYQWVTFLIFQINTKFVKKQPKSIFTQDNLHFPLISRKKSALYRRSFLKHALYTNVLLAFNVGEVCYISNKYWPNKFEKY